MLTGAGVTYKYDGDGKRVYKSNGTLVWYGNGSDVLDETDLTGAINNSAFEEYVAFAGGRMARRNYLSNIDYYFSDQIGSARVVAGSTGSILDDVDYDPFGREYDYLYSSGNTYKFAGKQRDSESGNDYFGARYYGSSMGRFLSPDDGSDQGSTNPQSWNLYSYVQNSPLTNADADGRSVQICTSFGYCRTVDDDVYQQAQAASNNSLNGPSLSNLQNSVSGSGNLTSTSTDADGKTTTTTVGSVHWTPENPGIQGRQAIQAFGKIGNQGMGAIKYFTVGSVAGGLVGGAALATGVVAGGAELTTLGRLTYLSTQEVASVVGWGTGQGAGVAATEQVTATLTEDGVAAMERQGLDMPTVQKWINTYARAKLDNPANMQAIARLDLMRKIAQLMTR